MRIYHLCLKVVESWRSVCLFDSLSLYFTHLAMDISILIFHYVLYQVWYVDGKAKTPLPKEDIGKLYSGDCYLVLYTYHSGDRKEDYFLCSWFGKNSIQVILM